MNAIEIIIQRLEALEEKARISEEADATLLHLIDDLDEQLTKLWDRIPRMQATIQILSRKIEKLEKIKDGQK